METYRFKSSLIDDMRSAELVISHCGAGTILEIMSLQKEAIGVINDELMDNHQRELANAMRDKELMVIADSVDDLSKALESDWSLSTGTPIGQSTVLLDEVSSLISLYFNIWVKFMRLHFRSLYD